MGFDKRVPRTGNDFFKYEPHKDAYALLIEINKIERDSPNNFGEKKDAAFADVTVFETEAELAEGAEPKVYRNARLDAAYVARELIKIYEDDTTETVRVLAQWKGTKPGAKPAWVLRFPEEAVREAVIEWYERREAARAEEVPDFLR